jgi:uncharacterized protein (TIGR00255 family)
MHSMTGFAARRGQGAGAAWLWELRAVNGKGFDLRLRLPEGIEGLEPALRAELSRRIARGSVSLSLKLQRETGAGAGPRVSPAGLAAALTALAAVQAAAAAAGATLAPPSAAEVLSLRGVLEFAPEDDDQAPLRAALLADLPPLLDAFDASRLAEGAALGAVLTAQIDRIATLAAEARAEAAAALPVQETRLRTQLARLRAEVADEARLLQELAALAVKSDPSEEIDRLDAHVAAARALIADRAPAGRRFEFLTQEFLREANTLCSKAATQGLTRVGLALKTVIDQVREQAANLE